MSDPDPIFVGGDGRSGTTLVSLMLDSHPEVVLLPELHFNGPRDLGPSVLEVLGMMDAGDWRVTTTGYQEHPEYKAPVQFVRRCERAGVSRSELGADIERAQETCASDLSTFRDRAILIELLGRRRARQEGKGRWGLKVMKQIRRAGLYWEAWPGACFLHVVRDGRDVATSQILDQSWGYTGIEEAIRGWSSFIWEVTALEQDGGRLWSVRYEDVVREPKPALGGFLEGAGLDWDDRMVRFYDVEHALMGSQVAHPSREALRKPLNEGSIGRYVRDLPSPWVRKFTLDAADALEAWGYEKFPSVRVDFSYGRAGCNARKECKDRIKRADERLGERYLSRAEPFEGQVRAAWINVEGVEYKEFFQTIKKMSKGVQEVRKAERIGVEYKRFDRRTFIPDIVDINTSKEYRAAGRMREAYRKGVEEMGGYPSKYYEPEEAECPLHNDVWWGAFAPSAGHRQGNVVTDEKLVAYINLRSYGDFAFYNLILGHGDYMQYGVVLGLHLAVMECLTAGRDEVGDTMRTIVYAGYFQGSNGLESWKKKAGFAPGYLVLEET